MIVFDKSHLPEHIQKLQKEKGTFDSPCQSICNYCPETTICQTCSMKREEKVLWKQGDEQLKLKLAEKIVERQKSL